MVGLGGDLYLNTPGAGLDLGVPPFGETGATGAEALHGFLLRKRWRKAAHAASITGLAVDEAVVHSWSIAPSHVWPLKQHTLPAQ